MNVLVYPKDSNPYQDLLYSRMPKSVKVEYLIHRSSNNFLSLMYLPVSILAFRLRGYRVFHIHWLYTFRFRTNHPIFKSYFFKVFMTLYCIFIIMFIKILRYKLVWTAHDLTPHGDYFTSNKLVSSFLNAMANLVVVHSRPALNEMKEYGLDISRTKIIPIGNYVNIYSNTISQSDARRKLGVTDQETVFGMFGKIEEYKGVIELIVTFNQIVSQNSRLFVVGFCPDINLKNRIQSLARKNSRIALHLHFVEDYEIEYYLNAFDVLIYPFQNITTSSSVLLAMSYKKPVICPKIGDLSELPDNTGIYYNPTDSSGLTNSMMYAINHSKSLSTLGKNAYKYVEKFNWSDSALKLASLYSQI